LGEFNGFDNLMSLNIPAYETKEFNLFIFFNCKENINNDYKFYFQYQDEKNNIQKKLIWYFKNF
jgi:hypothetical protein